MLHAFCLGFIKLDHECLPLARLIYFEANILLSINACWILTYIVQDMYLKLLPLAINCPHIWGVGGGGGVVVAISRKTRAPFLLTSLRVLRLTDYRWRWLPWTFGSNCASSTCKLGAEILNPPDFLGSGLINSATPAVRGGPPLQSSWWPQEGVRSFSWGKLAIQFALVKPGGCLSATRCN